MDEIKTLIENYRDQHETIKKIIDEYEAQDARLFQIMLDGVRRIDGKRKWTKADEHRITD